MRVGLNLNEISLIFDPRFVVMPEMIHFLDIVRQQKLLTLLIVIASLIMLMIHFSSYSRMY